MIKYRLVCREAHEFEAWFRSIADYDAQAAAGHVGCPHCGSLEVTKAVMAPAVGAGEPRSNLTGERASQMYALLRQLREQVEVHAEYVGPRFAEEARRIHNDETESRGIYGEASIEEVKSLTEEGVPIMPLPRVRGDLN